MPGGGGQGDADSAALQAVRGVTVAQVCLPQAVQAHHGRHGQVGGNESYEETSVLRKESYDLYSLQSANHAYLSYVNTGVIVYLCFLDHNVVFAVADVGDVSA